MPHVSSSITAPSRLNAYPVSNSQIDLWWNASSEPGGSIAGYNIFRDGTWAGSSTGTSFSDLGLAAGTAHLYTVAAYDTSWKHICAVRRRAGPTLSGIPAGLVAYYNFNEGAGTVVHDSSGNANNGAIGRRNVGRLGTIRQWRHIRQLRKSCPNTPFRLAQSDFGPHHGSLGQPKLHDQWERRDTEILWMGGVLLRAGAELKWGLRPPLDHQRLCRTDPDPGFPAALGPISRPLMTARR